jgi:hypothetical protein
VALVLKALGSDQPLDLGSLGVRLLALTLGLDFTADDVLADLLSRRVSLVSRNLRFGLFGTKKKRESLLLGTSTKESAKGKDSSSFFSLSHSTRTGTPATGRR